jgi:hypothetical protein
LPWRWECDLGKVLKEMSKHLGTHDLMDPYLPPTFSFEINIAEASFSLS